MTTGRPGRSSPGRYRVPRTLLPSPWTRATAKRYAPPAPTDDSETGSAEHSEMEHPEEDEDVEMQRRSHGRIGGTARSRHLYKLAQLRCFYTSTMPRRGECRGQLTPDGSAGDE